MSFIIAPSNAICRRMFKSEVNILQGGPRFVFCFLNFFYFILRGVPFLKPRGDSPTNPAADTVSANRLRNLEPCSQ